MQAREEETGSMPDIMSMTASDCCKILSDALDEGFLLTRNKTDQDNTNVDDTEINQSATSAFVTILSSSKQERLLYLESIRSSEFQKRHARRLFSSLFPILQHTLECEHYVPISAFEDLVEGENSNEGIVSEEKESVSIDDKLDSNEKSIDSTNKKRNPNRSQLSNCSIFPDPASTEALLFIKFSAMIVQAFLNNQIQRRKSKALNNEKRFDLMEEVFVVAELLHNNLFALNSCGREGANAQKEIVAMCEMYWQGRFTDSEVLVTQLIPLLVVKSLNGDATKADIKRLWNMRQTLHLLDFQEQDTISELRNLLLRTVSSPLYLKNTEGRKMIAYLFRLHTSILKDLHRSIRAQIPFSNISTLEAYGEIYFLSWNENNDSVDVDIDIDEDNSTHDTNSNEIDESSNPHSIQSALEESLQDLMFASMHASSPHMTKAILTLLEPIHAQKKNPDVDSLLYRLYNPILWRALSATNPFVRINACTLLHQTFPLHDPNLGNAHLKEINSKTIAVLLSLLNDDDPRVRVAGCNASIRILGVFWDALGSSHIRSLLNEIVMKHANDASSGMVRCQAVKGVSLLLDAKPSHGVLRPLLPFLGNRIHDSVERVRLATARMLLKLKGIKGIKYYHVVPSNHILSRLAAEGSDPRKMCGPVASAITELLVNSYFPKGVMGSEQTRRTLHFITQNRVASKVFYANIAKHLEINFCCKLIAMLFKTLKKAVENEVEEVDVRPGNVDESNDLNDMRVVASNTNLMTGVAETINIVYHSIAKDLLNEENKECLQFVQSIMSDSEIIRLCSYFEDQTAPSTASPRSCQKICSSLLSCISSSSIENTSQIFEAIETHAKRGRYIDLLPYFGVLCSMGHSSHVELFFTNHFHSFLEDLSTKFPIEISTSESDERNLMRKRKRSTPDVSNGDSSTPLLPCKSVVSLFAQVLRGQCSVCATIRDSILFSESACNTLEALLLNVNSTFQNLLNGGEEEWGRFNFEAVETLLQIWDVLCKFILHREARTNEHLATGSIVRNVLVSISNVAISTLLQRKDTNLTNSPFQDLNLSRISRISAIGTRPSDIKMAVSPFPLSLQHKGASPCSPSSESYTSFLDMEKRGSCEFKIKSDLSNCVLIDAVCVSLLRSSMSLADELLLLGLEDCADIIQLGQEWSKVFKKKTCMDAQSSLFPSFCRFVVLIGRVACNYDLIANVITIYDGLMLQNGAQEVLTKSIESILSYRNKNASKHISSFMSVMVRCLPVLVDEISSQNVTFKAIKEMNNGWTFVLKKILDHGKFVPLFVQTLLDFSQNANDENSHRQVLENLLLILCRNCTGKLESSIREIFVKVLSERSGSEIQAIRDERIEAMISAVLV